MKIDGEGAYLFLGRGLFGWACEDDLPAIAKSWDGRGRPAEVPCIVANLDAGDGGNIVVSPRQAGRKLVEAAASSEIVTGVVVKADSAGALVDFHGTSGYVPRNEMPLEYVREPAPPGAAWRGYVLDTEREPVVLSGFDPGMRREREVARKMHLRALRMDSVQMGLVVSVDRVRAIVSFEGGVVFGVAPAGMILSPELPAVEVGERRAFAVVSQFASPEASGTAELWLSPAKKTNRTGNGRLDPELPVGVADVPALPKGSPEWAQEAWRPLPARERALFALQHGLSGPRHSWSALGAIIGFNPPHTRRIIMSAEDALFIAAGLPGTEWPSRSEPRHELLMSLLGLPTKPTANGRRARSE